MTFLAIDRTGKKVSLSRIATEPSDHLERDQAEHKLEKLEQELSSLQELMWGARQHSVLVVLQGRDASGKDGTIKRVAGALKPRGRQATSSAAPTPEELEHDFLWRVPRHAPPLGAFAIFNRSHYEDVLAVRVHELAPERLWR